MSSNGKEIRNIFKKKVKAKYCGKRHLEYWRKDGDFYLLATEHNQLFLELNYVRFEIVIIFLIMS